MIFADWGLIDYQEAWDKQKTIAKEVLAQKLLNSRLPVVMEESCATPSSSSTAESDAQRIIFCEHPHVYTLGRNGKANNLLIDADRLKKINATYYHVDRGGDITYHGPGQIVGYPVLDLEQLHYGLKEYIFTIEEIIIKTLLHYDIRAGRLPGATGVWLDADRLGARKICAIGVHASRHITTHGFALNVNTDLDYYRYINPCGFVDKGVTSIQQERKTIVPLSDVKDLLRHYLQKAFG